MLRLAYVTKDTLTVTDVESALINWY